MNGTLFLGNYSNLGGGIATQGSVAVSFANTRALGNEANSSSSSNAGFIYLNSGTTSSIFVNCIFKNNGISQNLKKTKSQIFPRQHHGLWPRLCRRHKI